MAKASRSKSAWAGTPCSSIMFADDVIPSTKFSFCVLNMGLEGETAV